MNISNSNNGPRSKFNYILFYFIKIQKVVTYNILILNLNMSFDTKNNQITEAQE